VEERERRIHEYVTYVELQHAAAAVQAWGYVDDTAHHACTPLAGMPYVYGVTIRVRRRHSCKWTPCVDDTAHHACTPLAGMQPEYTPEYGYVFSTRVRGHHTRT
jgi:hypothetical protein